MNQFTVPIRPIAYFRDHAAGGARVSRNAVRTTVKLTETLMDLVEFAQFDIPGDRHSREHVLSLALEYGVDRPIHDWGYSVDEFERIAAQMKLDKGQDPEELVVQPLPVTRLMEGVETLPSMCHIRMEPQTRTKLSIYSSFLSCSQSVAIRHFVALAFRWYNESTYLDETMRGFNKETQEYVDRLRRQFDGRMKYAEERGWLND